MKRLLLLRHGQTEWNRIRRIQGQKDAPLDATGLAQAAAVAPAIGAYEPGVIWSSDLSRASVTADHVAEVCDLPVTRDERLREVSFGEREGLLHEEYQRIAPEEYDRVYGEGDFAAVAGCEKPQEVADRMVAALNDVLDLTDEGCAVVVSHGQAIKYAIVALLGWDDQLARTTKGLDNCGWAELQFDDRRRPMLAAYNRGIPIS